MNCVLAEDPRRRLDTIVLPKLQRLARVLPDVAYLAEPDSLPGAGDYSHLLLTGSELSAADVAPTDDALIRHIREFLVAERAILGICYGHQMLARALLDHDCCRKAARPEFGWKRTEIADDLLFGGITSPMFAHSHYDEVFGLDDRFVVTASTQDCLVQAFRLAGRPIWGVQFHPELDFEAASAMFAENRANDPRVEEFYTDELEAPLQTAQNERVLANFLATD